jgi:linoleate 10R-lipoxygenase
MGMKKVKGMLEADPAKRTFGHLQRNADGYFDDGRRYAWQGQPQAYP